MRANLSLSGWREGGREAPRVGARRAGEGRARPQASEWTEQWTPGLTAGSAARPREGVAIEPGGRGENFGAKRREACRRDERKKAALWLGPAQAGEADVFSGSVLSWRAATCIACWPAW